LADFIQQAVAQDQTPPRTEMIPATQQSQIANQAGAAVAQPQMPPQQMPQGAGMGATQENPMNAPEEQASPEEQEAYQDLFVRCMALINDTRAKGDEPAPADALIKMMSTKGKEAHMAVGETGSLVLRYIIDMMKRQGKEYPGHVIQEVGMDIVIELLDIANVSGAISNIPEEDSPEYQKLVELSALEMAKSFGEWMLQTGQADRQGHMREIQQQMQREADGGELDDWGMEELDPKIRAQVVGAVQQGAQ
jgi:hypothetical protein